MAKQTYFDAKIIKFRKESYSFTIFNRKEGKSNHLEPLQFSYHKKVFYQKKHHKHHSNWMSASYGWCLWWCLWCFMPEKGLMMMKNEDKTVFNHIVPLWLFPYREHLIPFKGSILFPCWEWWIPTVGMGDSHRGNILEGHGFAVRSYVLRPIFP